MKHFLLAFRKLLAGAATICALVGCASIDLIAEDKRTYSVNSDSIVSGVMAGRSDPAEIDYFQLLQADQKAALGELQNWISEAFLADPPGLPRPGISLQRPLSCELTSPRLKANAYLQAAQSAAGPETLEAARERVDELVVEDFPARLEKWRERAGLEARTPAGKAIKRAAATDRFWRWLYTPTAMTGIDAGLTDLSLSDVERLLVQPIAAEGMCAADAQNAEILAAQIEESGWPTNARDGLDVQDDAWLLAQHADHRPELQQTALDLLSGRLGEDVEMRRHYAYLFDRLAVTEGRRQLYGTQLAPQDGCMALRPVQDEAALDDRRRAMGLGPIADYLATFPNACAFEQVAALPNSAQLIMDQKFLEALEIEIEQSGSDPFSMDVVAQTYAMLGRVDLAIAYRRSNTGEPCNISRGEEHPLFEEAFKIEVGEAQIVIFNEAHDAPRHRYLVAEALPYLRDMGFEYFAAETFFPGVEQITDRDHATPEDGFYVLEPEYARLVETAVALGYNLVAYEYQPTEGQVDQDPFQARERGQAQNLVERILDQDPDAKIVILAGYGHASEAIWTGEGSENAMMAGHLRILSGIDPATIDQTACTHDGPERVSFMNSRDGHPVITARRGYDLQVIHPEPQFLYHRPAWIFSELRRPIETVEFVEGRREPVIIEARPEGRPSNALPVDRVLVRPGEDVRLALEPGTYSVSVFERGRTLVSETTITVE